MSRPGRALVLLPGGRLEAGDSVLVFREGGEPRGATVAATGFSSDAFRDDVVVVYPDGTRDLVGDRSVLRAPPPQPVRGPGNELDLRPSPSPGRYRGEVPRNAMDR